MARRSNAEKEAEAEAIKNWNPRYKHNVIIYLFMDLRHFGCSNWDYE